jgi:DIS3-like exonuclease 2
VQDLDDALHIKPLGEGRWEIGVHIADVSHFVRPGTAVDEEATQRCTSTYLVTRVIPMLPPVLSEELCSLNPGVDRLAFSCIWVMNDKGEMEPDEPWYGRTVIRSCAKLDYPTAQRMIEGVIKELPGATERPDIPTTDWDPLRRPPLDSDQDCNGIIHDVCAMHAIASKRRVKRFQAGALRLNRPKLSFLLDDDKNPIGFRQYPIKDSNRLVEEYMLLANYLVAEKLIRDAKDLAVLRRHPSPLEDQVGMVLGRLRNAGLDYFSWEPDDAGTLQRSLTLTQQVNPSLMEPVTDMCTQPNQPAVYFLAPDVSSTEWGHYALAIPYYTHFTSPIRRYADIMVHR